MVYLIAHVKIIETFELDKIAFENLIVINIVRDYIMSFMKF